MRKKMTLLDYPSMQTGPAKGQSMQSWLNWTGWGELFNVFLFFLSWVTMCLAYAPYIGALALIGMVSANLILIQGGSYWLLKRRGFFARLAPTERALAWFRRLYLFNALMLGVFPVWVIARMIVSSPEWPDVIVGLGYYAMAVGEYIHYFFFKINMRPNELRRVLRKRQPVPARFRRELRRLQQAYHRQPSDPAELKA
ncbi:MAG TPA: hypothetical protein PKH77_11275 [Anaerolineae bacterium]|nr:hypothetical protein [Anaerolineae bacterium]